MEKLMEEKLWSHRTAIPGSEAEGIRKILNDLSEERGDERLRDFPMDLCKLLIQREINDKKKAESFFFPELDALHDPWQMCDMDKAVERISRAIENQEGILILGDYDVDGTTATSMMYMFLREMTDNLRYYIPDRYEEGYGISYQAIDFALESKFSLIISLDCGIKALEKVEYANDRDIDFIICDHHTPGDKLPDAHAVLDPKRKDCNYPYNELSGCGVGFKLIQAICNKLSLGDKIPYKYLDLLVTSIAADIVPMTGENRILAHFGLLKLNKRPLPGIQALKEVSGMQRPFNVSDVVFKVAPRINSAGRMSHGSEAVRILVSEDKDDALSLAKKVEEHNVERRTTDHGITMQAQAQAEEMPDFAGRNTTVLFDPEWHKGVIGIVASRMIERYYRPTIILTGKDGVLSGSARSVSGFDVYSAIEECSDFLIQFGGHKYAAGMTMKEEDFENFRERFEQVVSSMIEERHKKPVIEVDMKIDLEAVDLNFARQISRFAPFGPGNMSPLFHSENLLPRYPRELKDKHDNSHLKMKVFQPENEYNTIDVIGFGLGKLAEELVDGMPFEMVYAIEENIWQGRSSVQLVAKDIRL